VVVSVIPPEHLHSKAYYRFPEAQLQNKQQELAVKSYDIPDTALCSSLAGAACLFQQKTKAPAALQGQSELSALVGPSAAQGVPLKLVMFSRSEASGPPLDELLRGVLQQVGPEQHTGDSGAKANLLGDSLAEKGGRVSEDDDSKASSALQRALKKRGMTAEVLYEGSSSSMADTDRLVEVLVGVMGLEPDDPEAHEWRRQIVQMLGNAELSAADKTEEEEAAPDYNEEEGIPEQHDEAQYVQDDYDDYLEGLLHEYYIDDVAD
jgi:hypothetical protein